MDPRKILVTGGAGFIGSNLALELQSRYPQASVIVIDNLRSGSRENLRGFKGELLQDDITDKSFPEKLSFYQPDAIFHLAALSDTRIEDAPQMDLVNVFGFQNILELARKTSSMVVYASSAAVYGLNTQILSETSALQPANAYGVSKLSMEKLARSFSENFPKLKVVGLRYFNVYGPGEGHKNGYASMVSQMLWKIQEGQRPRLFKHGEQMRDFIYVKDAVELTLRAIDSPSSEIFNGGTGQATSFNELLNILNDALGSDIKPDYIENPYPFFQPHTQADTHKVKNKLNFSPRYDIVNGIQDYLKNIKNT